MKTKLVATPEYLLLIDEESVKTAEDYLLEAFEEVQHPYKYRDISIAKDSIYTKIIAYYPLTKEAKELDLPELPNPFEKAVDIEAFKKYPIDTHLIEHSDNHILNKEIDYNEEFRNIWIEGYKAAQSDKQFSLEDMKEAYELGSDNGASYQRLILLNLLDTKPNFDRDAKKSFDNLCKSLSTQQLPINFEPELEIYYLENKGSFVGGACRIQRERLKIVNNVVQGTYKY